MATSPNFGWLEPDNTDLVKNGALAIRTAVNAIDSSMGGLKGGTTGQVLSKTSGTDMAFTWTTPSSGMTNPMTTTGDTIYSSSGSTPARLAIGSSGQVMTVSGGVPTWASPSSGSMTLLSTTTLSGSSYVTISGISQAYTDLKIVMHGAGNSSNVQHWFQTFKSGTQSNPVLSWANGTAAVKNASSNAYPTLTFRGSSASQNTFVWEFKRYTNANSCPVVSSGYITDSSGVGQVYGGGGTLINGIDEIQIYPNAGTFNAGTIYIYGVN